MRTQLKRLGALALGLGLMTGGLVSVGAVNAAPVSDSHSPSAAQVREARTGLSAPMIYRFVLKDQTQLPSDSNLCVANQADDAAEGDIGTEANDPNDTDNIQDENAADDATETDGEQETANDTDNVQDENGADDATENPNDTDNLQCGDSSQDATSAQASGQQSIVGGTQGVSLLRAQVQIDTQVTDVTEAETGTEQESATETGGDEADDGIQCEQQGENEGENAGC